VQKLKKGMKATVIFLIGYAIAAIAIGRLGGSETLQAWVSMVASMGCAIGYVCYVHLKQRRGSGK